LVAKGQCECYLQDENKKERFVSQFGVGTHFGEIAILTGGKRTASIMTKNYSSLGVISKDNFEELCRIYPDIRHRLMAGLGVY